MIAVRTPTSQITDGNDFRARIATSTTPTTAATAEASTGVAAPVVMLATMIAITMSDGTAPAPDSSQPLTPPAGPRPAGRRPAASVAPAQT